MLVVRTDAPLTPSELLQAAGQLGADDLEELTRSVIALRAARAARSRPAAEVRLLQRINDRPDPELQRRYDQLVGRRRDETLTPAERAELLRLSAEREAFDANRVEALAELARLRGVSLRAVLQELGLEPPTRG